MHSLAITALACLELAQGSAVTPTQVVVHSAQAHGSLRQTLVPGVDLCHREEAFVDLRDGNRTATSKSWQVRAAETILSAGPRVLVSCHRDSGIEYAVDRLDSADAPLVRLWITRDVDTVQLGNMLSDAVANALGSPLFGRNVPFQYGLSTLGRHLGLLAPLRFVAGWVTHLGTAADELISLIRPPNSLILVSDGPFAQAATAGFATVDNQQLALEDREAIAEVGSVLTTTEALALLKRSGRRYGSFRAQLAARLGVPEPLPAFAASNDRPTAHVELAGLRIEDQIAAYQARHRWIEAFNLTCSYLPDAVEGVLERAANELFDLGEFDFLWTRLNRLPPDVKRVPQVAYWLLATAAATNRQNLVTELVSSVLTEHSAPDLRAYAAVLRHSGDALDETRVAVEERETPITLRAHAFALAVSGHRQEATRHFRRALSLAERTRANHLVVACATDLSNHEICLGRYRNGMEWANWALAEYTSRGLGEELRRVTAAASLVFARLLIGELPLESDALPDVAVASNTAGAPGTEGVVSTLADLAAMRGELEVAERLYRLNYRAAPVDGKAFVALDLVRFLLSSGDQHEALVVADQIQSISRSSTPQERAFGDLALGMVQAYRRQPTAERMLAAAIQALAGTSFAIFESLACVWLAMYQLESGRQADALRTLDKGAAGLRELGDSGWNWMGSTNPRIDAVRKHLGNPGVRCELHFLGAKKVVIGGREVDIRLRHCESLALLAQHPEGITAQRLTMMQYGDHGQTSTVKANISHLRKTLGIEPSPYRLTDTFSADFVQLLEYLERDQLHLALSLYDGPLLPDSTAPAVVELREHLEASIRSAVLASRDPDALVHLATVLEDDLELWERARENLSMKDHRRPLINARIRRIRKQWDLRADGSE